MIIVILDGNQGDFFTHTATATVVHANVSNKLNELIASLARLIREKFYQQLIPFTAHQYMKFPNFINSIYDDDEGNSIFSFTYKIN